MAGKKSKDKGKRYEDKIASIIRTFFNLKPYECLRASDSGNGPFEFGDIYFTEPRKYGGLIIECKFHNDWTFKDVFPKLSKKFEDFIEEVLQAKTKYLNKLSVEPEHCIVVFSKPYYPSYCIYKHNDTIPIVNKIISSSINLKLIDICLFEDYLTYIKGRV